MVMPLTSADGHEQQGEGGEAEVAREPAAGEQEQRSKRRNEPEQAYTLEQAQLAEAIAEPRPGRIRGERPGGLRAEQDGDVRQAEALPVCGDDVERERHQGCPAEPLREQEEAEAPVGPEDRYAIVDKDAKALWRR